MPGSWQRCPRSCTNGRGRNCAAHRPRPARRARHIALTVLAVIASVAALYLAQAFFVSLLLGILIAYTLNPLVVYLGADQGAPRDGHDHRDGRGAWARWDSALIRCEGRCRRSSNSCRKRRGHSPPRSRDCAPILPATCRRCRALPRKSKKPRRRSARVPSPQAGGRARCQSTRPGFKLNNFLLVGSVGAIGAVGRGDHGALPDVLPAAGRRHVQAQAGAAHGPIAVEQEDHRPDPGRHQRFHSEIPVHAAGDERSGRRACLDRLSRGSASRMPEPGRSPPACCT